MFSLKSFQGFDNVIPESVKTAGSNRVTCPNVRAKLRRIRITELPNVRSLITRAITGESEIAPFPSVPRADYKWTAVIGFSRDGRTRRKTRRGLRAVSRETAEAT